MTARKSTKGASKPTFASVTMIPCKCGYLDRASDEPEIPIVFDARMNEYHITNTGKNRGYTMIYHCPWCGGAAPRSRRASFFATVTRKEAERLRSLVSEISTLDDAITKFGKPDLDMPDGTTIKTPASESKPSAIRSYRTLHYVGLSKTAEVHLVDYGPDGGVRITFQGKYLGKG